jgi:hypothetical protein
VYADVANEIFLLDLRSEHYFGLDEVGSRIWQLIVLAGDLETIVGQMLAEYEVDEETLRQALATLIAELAAKGLVTVDAEG